MAILKRAPARSLTREDVVSGYRQLLGRDPESAQVIRRHIESHADAASFRGSLQNSAEYIALQNRRIIGPGDLDQFVTDTDDLGTAGTPQVDEFWATISYQHDTPINQDLDPFSEEYAEQQIELYRELSGRDVDQETHEQSDVPVDHHVGAANPYGDLFAPSVVAMHIGRVARAIQYANLDADSHIIDMGCGWGISTELMAYTRLRVTSLDINPSFVELVGRRAKRAGHPVQAVAGRFDHIPGDTQYDAALFYESLHHAIRPWEVLEYVHSRLRPGGKLLIAGEPINNFWKNWGLRTDPYSLYCIRKFGWFESGWTAGFLRKCMARSGFEIDHMKAEKHDIGWVTVARAI